MIQQDPSKCLKCCYKQLTMVRRGMSYSQAKRQNADSYFYKHENIARLLNFQLQQKQDVSCFIEQNEPSLLIGCDVGKLGNSSISENPPEINRKTTQNAALPPDSDSVSEFFAVHLFCLLKSRTTSTQSLCLKLNLKQQLAVSGLSEPKLHIKDRWMLPCVNCRAYRTLTWQIWYLRCILLSGASLYYSF